MTSRSLDVSQKRFLSESLAVSSIDSYESTRPVFFPSAHPLMLLKSLNIPPVNLISQRMINVSKVL